MMLVCHVTSESEMMISSSVQMLSANQITGLWRIQVTKALNTYVHSSNTIKYINIPLRSRIHMFETSVNKLKVLRFVQHLHRLHLSSDSWMNNIDS